MAPRCAITAGSPRGIGATDRPRKRGHRCAALADSLRCARSPARTARPRSALTAALRRADRSGVARSWNTRAPNLPRQDRRCASLRSLRPRLAPSAALRARTARPALSLRPVARRLARRANQDRRAGARLNSPSAAARRRRATNSATLACWWRGSLLALSKTCRSLPTGPAPRGFASGAPTSSASVRPSAPASASS